MALMIESAATGRFFRLNIDLTDEVRVSIFNGRLLEGGGMVAYMQEKI